MPQAPVQAWADVPLLSTRGTQQQVCSKPAANKHNATRCQGELSTNPEAHLEGLWQRQVACAGQTGVAGPWPPCPEGTWARRTAPAC